MQLKVHDRQIRIANSAVMAFGAPLLLLIVAGCSILFGTVAEIRNVQAMNVHVLQINREQFVEVSGLIGDSAYVVEKATIENRQDTISVKLTIALTHSNLTGEFHEVIFVPSTVKMITFGNEESIVWKRSH